MAKPIDIGTLTATINATVKGFDKTLDSMNGLLKQFVADANKAFDKIPNSLGKSVEAAGKKQVQTQTATNSQLERLRRELTNREKQLTLESHEYQVHLQRDLSNQHKALVDRMKLSTEDKAKVIAQIVLNETLAVEQIRKNHKLKMDQLNEAELNYVINLRQQLIAREKKVTLESTQYQIMMLNQQKENMKATIEANVSDKKRAASLIKQLEKTTAAEIEAIQRAGTAAMDAEQKKQTAAANKAKADQLAAEQRYAQHLANLRQQIHNATVKLFDGERAYKKHMAEQEMREQTMHIQKTVTDQTVANGLLQRVRLNYREQLRQIDAQYDAQEAATLKAKTDREKAENDRKLADRQRVANQILSFEQSIQDRINRLTMTSERYQLEQVRLRFEEEKKFISANVRNHMDAARMRVELERATWLEIKAIQNAHKPKVGTTNTTSAVADAEREASAIRSIRRQLTADINKMTMDEFTLKRTMLNRDTYEQSQAIHKAVKNEGERNALLTQLRRAHQLKMDRINQDEANHHVKVAQDEANKVRNIQEKLHDQTARLMFNEVTYKIMQKEKEYEAFKQIINREIRDEVQRTEALKQLERNLVQERKRIHEQDGSAGGNPWGGHQTVRSGVANVGMAAGAVDAVLMMDIKKSLELAREYDQDLASIDSVALLTQQQLGRVHKEILDMGETIPKTAHDMATGLYNIVQSGYAGEQAMGVLNISARAATAGLSTTQEASRGLMSLMSAYNTKTVPDAQRIMDVMFQTVKDGVITFGELATHISYVSTAAATSGVRFEEVGAALSDLTTNGGMPAAQAIQTLNMVLHKITTPTIEGSKAAQGWGVSWFNAAEAGKHIRKVGLAKALQEIGEAAGGNKARFSQMMGDQEAARGMMVLARNDAENYVRFLDRANNAQGAMGEAFARMTDSYNAKIQFMANALERIRIQLGERMLDALLPVIYAIRHLAEAFGHSPGWLQTFTAMTGLASAALLTFTVAAAGVGFVLFGINAGLTALTPILISAGWVAAGTTISFSTLAKAIWGATIPMLVFSAQFIALAGAMWFAWKTNLGGIRTYTEETMGILSDWFGWGAKEVKSSNKEIHDDTENVWSMLFNTVATTLVVLGKIISTALGLFGNVFHMFGVLLTGDVGLMWQELKRAFRNGLGFWYDYAVNILKELGNLFGAWATATIDIVGGVWEAMKDPDNRAGGVKKVLKGMVDLASQWGKSSKSFGVHTENFVNNFVSAGVKMQQEVDALKLKMSDMFKGVDFSQVVMPPPLLPKTRGLNYGDDAEAYGEMQLRRDIIFMKKRIAAEKMTHAEAIAAYKELAAAHQLNERQKVMIQSEISKLENKIMKEGTAAARKELAARKAEERKARQEQKAEEREASEAFKRELTARENTVKGMNKRTFAERQKALMTHYNLLEGLRTKAVTEGDRRELANRLGNVKRSMVALTDERMKAELAAEEFIRDSKAKRLGDSLDDRILKIKQAYRKEMAAAESHGVDMHRIAAIQREMDMAIIHEIAETKSKLQDEVDALQGGSLERQLNNIDKHYEAEKEKLNGHRDMQELIQQAWDLKRQQAIEEHNKKLLAKFRAGFNDTMQFFSTLADSTKNVWDKILAGMDAFLRVFEQQVADYLAPYFKQIMEAFAKDGVNGLRQLADAWLTVGIEAMAAGAKAAITWFQMLGPIGWVAAAILGVAAVVWGVTAAMANMAEHQRQMAKEAREFAEDIEDITAKTSGHRGRMASSDLVQALRNNEKDDKVKEYNDKLYSLRQGQAGLRASGDPAALDFANRMQAEIDETERRYRERRNALDAQSRAEHEKAINQLYRDQANFRYDQLIMLAEDHNDKALAMRLTAEKEGQQAETDLRQQFDEGVIQTQVELEQAIYNVRWSIHNKLLSDLSALEQEHLGKVLEIRAQYEEDIGNKTNAANYRRLKEINDAESQYAEDYKNNLLSRAEYQEFLGARIAAINAKYAAESVDAWETAYDQEQELIFARFSTNINISKMWLEHQREQGLISVEQFEKYNAELEATSTEAAMVQIQNEVFKYEQMLRDQGLSAEKRQEIEVKLANAINKMTKDGLDSLQNQITAYTKRVEDKYKRIEEKYQDQKKALEDQRDAETASHKLRLKQLEDQMRPLQRQLEVIQEINDAIKARYELDRQNINEEDKGKFNEALNNLTIGAVESEDIAKLAALRAELNQAIIAGRSGQADMIREEIATIERLTFDGIDTLRQNADNRLALEEITAEEHAKIAMELAIRKAKLAKQELADENLSYKERTRIQTVLAEAYEEWREIQLNLLDEQEAKELSVQEQSARTIQTQLDNLKSQQREVKNFIEDIEVKYQTSIDKINEKIDGNKKAWQDALKAIRERTDTEVKKIIQGWDNVRLSIEAAVAAANRLAAARAAAGGGGPGYYVQSGSYTNASGGITYKTTAYARGGYVRGGTKGVDSVPIVAQDGEYVTDTSLTKGLEEMVRYFQGMATGAMYSPMGGGARIINTKVELNGLAVRSDKDIVMIAEKVSEIIAKEW